MNKLKTLKDFSKEVIGIEDKMISETKLKAEAVKDYKRFTMKTKEGIEMSNTARYIKWKFNLTEEELKNE